MPQTSVKDTLKQAQDELTALQADLPKLEALLSEHTAAADAAKREKSDWETQATLQAKRNGFESILSQHRRDIDDAERRVAELQARSDDEGLLGVVTQASVRYPEIRAELDQLFAGADAALVTAIQLAADLAAEGNRHLHSANLAALHLMGKAGQPTYERDRAAREEVYAAAVAGTDVPPLSTYTSDLQPWPADYGASPYKTLGHFDPHRTGLTMQHGTPIADSADTEFDALRDAAMSEMLGG